MGAGDLAYIIGFEHVANSVVGVPDDPYTLRVTHIFRREPGLCKFAARHADYVPIDQTLVSGGTLTTSSPDQRRASRSGLPMTRAHRGYLFH